jgi:hypothetical protein
MIRIAIAAALVAVSTSAFAQVNSEVRDMKFGAGCLGPVSTFATRLGTCAIEGSMSRIWCPNGQVFERKASDYERIPSSYVVRAVCNLNQVL